MPEPNATPAPLTDGTSPAPGYAPTVEDAQGVAALLVQCRLNYAPEMVDDDQGPFLTEADALDMARFVWKHAIEPTRAKLAEAEAQRDADQRASVVSANAKHEMWEQAIALRDTSAAQLEALWPLLTAAESRVEALELAAIGARPALETAWLRGRQPSDKRALDALDAALSPSQDAKDGGAV